MKKILIFLLFNILVFGGCGNEPLFTRLANSNITVIVKGTYASYYDPGEIRPWSGSAPDDDDISGINPDSYPTKFMLDIAELRFDGDKFANYRETYSANVFNADSSNSEPLFNGTGVTYECDNVYPDEEYNNLQIYIRKMIFNNAYQYNGSWGNQELAEVIFEEKDTYGYDFNQKQIYTNDDATNDPDNNTNIVFPLNIPLSDNFIYNTEDDFVVEIRLVIKNYVKGYEWVDSDNDVAYAYYGISDWLRDILVTHEYRGGNLIAGVHTYNKNKVVDLLVDGSNNISQASGTGSYVVAIPAGEDIANYTTYDSTDTANKIPPIVTWTNNNNYTLKNLSYGKSYDVWESTAGVTSDRLPSTFADRGTIVVAADGSVTTSVP